MVTGDVAILFDGDSPSSLAVTSTFVVLFFVGETGTFVVDYGVALMACFPCGLLYEVADPNPYIPCPTCGASLVLHAPGEDQRSGGRILDRGQGPRLRRLQGAVQR